MRLMGLSSRLLTEGVKSFFGSEEFDKDVKKVSEGDLVRAMTDGLGWKVLIESLEEQENALKEEMIARDLSGMTFAQIYQWIVDKRSKVFAFRALKELARKKISDGLEAQEKMRDMGVNAGQPADE